MSCSGHKEQSNPGQGEHGQQSIQGWVLPSSARAIGHRASGPPPPPRWRLPASTARVCTVHTQGADSLIPKTRSPSPLSSRRILCSASSCVSPTYSVMLLQDLVSIACEGGGGLQRFDSLGVHPRLSRGGCDAHSDLEATPTVARGLLRYHPGAHTERAERDRTAAGPPVLASAPAPRPSSEGKVQGATRIPFSPGSSFLPPRARCSKWKARSKPSAPGRPGRRRIPGSCPRRTRPSCCHHRLPS